MAFGIDTLRSHLDLLPAISTGGDFFAWNGGARPLFAGRNFLGGPNGNVVAGDFIWGHAEATNASSEPDGDGHGGYATYPLPAGDPSPDHPENLTLNVDRVAPIQGSISARQQEVTRGILYGELDADAICNRLVAAILSGEFAFPDAKKILVWLSVDSTIPFSVDYWTGWADTVNGFILPIISQGALLAQIQPFRAAIICDYVAGSDGKFRPEPHVTAALASKHPGMDTSAHGCWANSKLWDNAPADLVANGSPLLDWTRFDPPTAPVLWRFAKGFVRGDGTPAGLAFDIDAVNPAAPSVDFMLQPQSWQPIVPSIQNAGFSNADAITDTQSKCLQTTPLQDMDDSNFGVHPGHFHVPGGPVKVIGRYIQVSAVASMGVAEARKLSDAGFSIFTIWQSFRLLGGTQRQPRSIDYFDPDPDGDPNTHDDAGTQDGRDAFQYCGSVLKQPPQTPVFFATDFDPYDPPGASNEDWIKSYFTNIKAARDDYSARTGRHYLIGVYGVGRIMKALYAQGIVSHFWQSGSTGRSGNKSPNWPWYHANRWQYQADKAICGIGGVKAGKPFGIDPDADWGDGGIWSLASPLSQQMELMEQLTTAIEHGATFDNWGNLVLPVLP
jgi:hypothetical protein